MKLDRVFVCFLKKDGEEHLLYKKNDNLYVDLNTKEKITKDDIDLRTLIYFKDTIYCIGNNKSKLSIKKEFREDRKELIDIEPLCIVNVEKVSDLKKSSVMNSHLVKCEWIPVFLYKALLVSYYGSYKDLRNNKLYLGRKESYFENGTIYVDDGKGAEIMYLKERYSYQKSMEKSQVLKLAYKISKDEKLKK